MWRKRENIKRWHKAFIWALLAGVAKAAIAGAKVAGTAAVKGAGMLAKGVGAVGKAAVDTGWKAGEKIVGGIINPAEKAFEAFKKGGAKAGLKTVGEELIKGTDVNKSMELIKGVGDFMMPEAQAATGAVQPPAITPEAVSTSQAVAPSSTFNKAFLDKLVGQSPDLTEAGRMANLGGTLADVLRSRIGAPVKGTDSESYTASYRKDIVTLAGKGIEGYDEADWDKLREDYPTNTTQIDKLQLEYTPVKTNPEFKDEGGIGAWSKNKAKVTPKAKSMIDAIKSEADLQEYKKSVAEKMKAGIWKNKDHKILREYYGF